MQGTADFHHHIAYPLLPHPDGLFQHATAFDAAIDMFDAHPTPRDLPIVRLLGGRQRVPARFLRRLEDRDAVPRAPVKAQVLQPLALRRQRIRRGIGQALVVDAARHRLTEEHDAQCGIDQ